MTGFSLLGQAELIPDWLQYGAFGLLVVMILGIGKLARAAGKWCGEHAVVPLRDACTTYLSQQTAQGAKNAELLGELHRGQQSCVETQRQHTEVLTNLSESVRNLYCAKHAEHLTHGR